MTAFSDPDPVLLALRKVLGSQFIVTNQHIDDGTNTHARQMPSGHLKVNTPKQDEVEATSLSQYFPQRHYVPLTHL